MTDKQVNAALWLMYFGAGMTYKHIAGVVGKSDQWVANRIAGLERRLYNRYRVGFYCVPAVGHPNCCRFRYSGEHVTGARLDTSNTPGCDCATVLHIDDCRAHGRRRRKISVGGDLSP